MVLVTDGSAAAILNGNPLEIAAPCALCLTGKDSLFIQNAGRIAAQTLSFSADFFGSEAEGRISAGLTLFERSSANAGIFPLDKTAYRKIWEWFFIAGAEVFAQSDSLWVCRIKKYLLQIIGMLEDLCREQEQDPVRLALNFIYANYFKKITLDELCRHSRTNRVSLNKMFREYCGCTAMSYLNIYRLTMAEKILTYTRMNLSEVAHATGFEYDTYFIRQFTRWKGISPTQFRKTVHRELLLETSLL